MMRLPTFLRLRHRTGGAPGRKGRPRPLTIGMAFALAIGVLGVLDVGEASATLSGTFTVPTQSPSSIGPGATVTYSPISATRGSTTPGFVKLTAPTGSSGLPTGATFTDSGDGSSGCVAVASNAFTFSAASVATSSSMSGGTYPFTITATGYSNGSCTTPSGGTSTGNATLVVTGPTWNANSGLLSCGTANNTTVPVGTTSLTATLLGGGGGGGGAGTASASVSDSFGGSGAPGGSVSITYPVTSGSVYVDVGCGGGGGAGDAATAAGGTAGPGYTPGGGGGAGSGTSTLGAAGGAGGGSTALCLGTASCTTPVVVAAGGGGGGGGCGYNGNASNCTGASGAGGGAGGSTNTAAAAGSGGSTNGGSGTGGSTGSDGSTSGTETGGSGFGGSGGGSGVREGTANHDVGGPGGGGGGGIGGNGALNNGNGQANNGVAGVGGNNNVGGTGGNTGISGGTTAEGASGTTSAGGAGGTTAAGTGTNSVNMGGGGGGAGWTGGGGGGPDYTVSSSNQSSAGGGGGGSSWALSGASATFSSIAGGFATSCGPADNANSTGLSLGLGGYGDGQATSGGGNLSGAAGIGDAGCPGNITLSFNGAAPSAPTLTSGSLAVAAGGTLSATTSAPNAASYTESGFLPSGMSFNSTTGAFSGTTTATGSYPFTVTATNSYGTSSAGSFTLVVTGAPAKVVFSIEPPTTGTAGSALTSFAVSIEDAYGNVETGSNTGNSDTINLTVASGPGAIASGASISASGGVATFSSTILDTAGSYTFTATDGTRSLTTATSMTATVIAPASRYPVRPHPGHRLTHAGAGDNLTITAEDTYGNTITTYTGTHNLTFGGASAIGSFTPTVTNSSGTAIAFGSATAITFTNGQATISGSSNGVMTLYQAGSDSITVTDNGSYNNGAGTAVTVNPITPNKVVFTVEPPATGTAGTALTSFAASVEDTYGNVETGSNTGHDDTINLTVASGPGAIASGASVSASGGVATFASTILDTAGSYTFTATDGSRSITTATSTTNTVSPTTPNKVVFTVEPPTTGTAGTALTSFAASVEDTFGNVETGSNTGHDDTINLNVATGPGAIASGASATASGGVATFSATILDTAGSYTFTATDGSRSITTATSTTITVARRPSKVVFTVEPPATGTAGTALTSFAVSVEDAYGNVETGSNTGNNDTINLTMATGPGSIASGASVTASGGVATFSSTILDTAGSYTFTATDGSRSITTATSTSTTVSPTTPSKVVFTTEPPSTGTAGTALTSFAASVEDTYGNVETGSNTGHTDTINLTVATGPGTIASGTSATASGGVATFNSTVLDTAGSYTLTATDGSRRSPPPPPRRPR